VPGGHRTTRANDIRSVLHDPPRSREDERQRQVCYSVAQHPRCVADGDPPPRRLRKVDVVEAHAEVRDHTQPGRACHQKFVHGQQRAAQQPFSPGQRLLEHPRWRVRGHLAHLAHGLQPRQHFRRRPDGYASDGQRCFHAETLQPPSNCLNRPPCLPSPIRYTRSMPYTRRSGVRIHYRVIGRGSPLVLVHGYSSSGLTNWVASGWVELLAAHHTLLVPDLRGHGRSQKPYATASYSVHALAEDVLAVMDREGFRTAPVFGYSMGGMVALELLLTHPDRIEAAIIEAWDYFPRARGRFAVERRGRMTAPRASRRTRQLPRRLSAQFDPIAPDRVFAASFRATSPSIPPAFTKSTSRCSLPRARVTPSSRLPATLRRPSLAPGSSHSRMKATSARSATPSFGPRSGPSSTGSDLAFPDNVWLRSSYIDNLAPAYHNRATSRHRGGSMEFRDNERETAFRAEVSSFLDTEFPPEYSNRPTEWGLFNGAGRAVPGFMEFMRGWTAKLNQHGWGAPAWPKEHGGGGLSVKEQFILSEEFAWRRAPRPGGIGHGWAGPTVMVYGTDEQKAEYLPKIISGEHIWCQLFSEPGAGSDLASLQTRAIRDGDDYVVNGQKIWTSGAQHAHMGILIARTNPDAPKHRGISYFLVDMKTPGITVRPLINMLNSHEFNEVYFEDVRIPRRTSWGRKPGLVPGHDHPRLRALRHCHERRPPAHRSRPGEVREGLPGW